MLKTLKIGMPSGGRFKLGGFASILQGVSAVALLATSAWLISRAAEQPPIMYLMIAVVGVRGFALGRASFRYAERITLHDSAFRMLARIRPVIFSKLIPFAPAGLGANGRGELMNRVVSDVDELQNLSLRIITPLVQSVTISVLAVIGLSLLLPSAGFVLLACLLAGFFLAMPASGAINARGEKLVSEVKGKFENKTLELLEHFEVLHSYGWLPALRKDIQTLDIKRKRIENRSALGSGVGQTLFSALASTATIGSCYLAANATHIGELNGVNLALVALLPFAVFDVVTGSQNLATAWRRYKASANRILQVTDRVVPAELSFSEPQTNPTTELAHFDSAEMKGVFAGYPGQPDALKGLNFKINAGENVALVGPSGIGKSTAALLLTRFLQPRRGTFEINGVSASSFDSDSIRSQIGYLEQVPTIFLGTVRANLLIAKPEASDEMLIDALNQVGLWNMFEQRGGLDTELGDRGVLISGGEAQRLALARAMLANFKLLILDEPTASVDQSQSLRLMTEIIAAAKLDKTRAVLLITHEAQLAALADRIIELA